MKTVKLLAFLLLVITTTTQIRAQGISFNGDTIKNGGGTVYYCPNQSVSVDFWGYDSVNITVNQKFTATDTILKVTILPYTINEVLYGPFITVSCYKNSTNTQSTVLLKPNTISTTISAISDSLFCNRKTNIMVMGVNDVISNINWNLGQSNFIANSITTIAFSGDSQKYIANILLTNGCSVKDSLIIYKKSPSGKICWTTVDTSSTHNIIIWDTTGTSHQAVDSIKLYFYNANNKWQFLSAEKYTDTNKFFIDMLNNPNATTVRYCLTMLDSCGYEEPFANSPWQNTMWIQQTNGTFNWGGTGYLIENNPQPVLTYYLYRNDTLIDSISGTQNTITDPNYNHLATYYVGAKLNVDMCALSPIAEAKKPVLANTTTQTYSNRLKGKTKGVNEISNISIDVYPNPFTDKLNVSVSKPSILEVMDATGRIVLSSNLKTDNNIISINQPSGLYLVRVNGVMVKKIVKQ